MSTAIGPLIALGGMLHQERAHRSEIEPASC
jgi:hypothetical protein